MSGRRQLSEKWGVKLEPGTLHSSHFPNCSIYIMLYTNLQNAFSALFSSERELGEGQSSFSPAVWVVLRAHCFAHP